MRLQIKSGGFDLTPIIQQFLEKKMMALEKFLGRWEKNSEVLLRVEISKITNHHRKGIVFYAEANLDLPQNTLRIEETNDELRIAIERLRDRLKNEILKLKERLADH